MNLITVNQLHSKLSDNNLRIIDARHVLGQSDAGWQSYLTAHLPGALHVNLDEDLSDQKSNPLLGRHPLPNAGKFSRLLSRLGIQPETQVVVYDQADGAMAACRFWFLMRLAGHRNVAVLDGGMNAWLAAQFPIVQNIPEPVATNYKVEFQSGMLVEVGELKTLMSNIQDTVLIDARAVERFRGDVEPIDKKAGHIPGAANRPFSLNMFDGVFKSSEQLRSEFAPFIEGKKNIILSCGSGVTACHQALALSHAGFENYRLFAPSWSGWVADDENPVALGNE